MTYRELYAQNCARDSGKACHIGRCPDTWLADLTHEKAIRITCPPDHGAPCHDKRGECERCWDREIPAEAALPEWAKVPDATLSVTVTGEDIHVHTDGTADDLMLDVLAAMNYVAQEVYQAGNDWNSSEELVHMLQEALKPTSKIWDFSEGGGADADR